MSMTLTHNIIINSLKRHPTYYVEHMTGEKGIEFEAYEYKKYEYIMYI